MAKKAQNSDFLNQFISEKTGESLNQNVSEIKDVIVNQNNAQTSQSTLGYLSVDLKILPNGIFYKPGTQIKIKAATVAEVQAYSVVDDANMIDVTEKMNQMLSSCVKVIHPNGAIGSYKDLKDGDRIFLIFMIRELTFQQGCNLAKDTQCSSCSHDFKINFRSTGNATQPKTFVCYEMDEKIAKYFDNDNKVFSITVDDEIYRLAPPTIGIQESFFSEIKRNVQSEKTPNVSFMKIVPYLLWDRNSITDEGIKKKEEEFKKMSMKTFQVLNKMVDLMKFGIKELMQPCPKCGSEVRTTMTFPAGASGIFIIPDPFADLDKK